ncbi:MAG TPA: radical SAM protein [Candidatus Kapabacteria bacterium]|nr:radical SAM protein [Candidatus Kapabacteria bacterium]
MFVGYIEHLDQDRVGALQYLYVSLSNICNAHCAYCDVHSQPPPVRPFDRDDLTRIFGDARSLGCGTVHFLGGGEPLVAPRFADAVGACNDLGLHIAITTNGSHLARRLRSELRGAVVDMIIVSIDSHRSQEHNTIRGMRRLWEWAVEGIATARELTPSTHLVVNHVVTASNIRLLPEYIEWAGGLGINAINLIPVKDSPDLGATLEHVTWLAEHFMELTLQARAYGIELLCEVEDVMEWRSHLLGTPGGREYRCAFPEHTLYIDFPTGSTFPCDCTIHRAPASTFDLGNIWHQPLSAIWGDERIRNLREVLASPCDPGCKRDCDWNNVRTNRQLVTVGS